MSRIVLRSLKRVAGGPALARLSTAAVAAGARVVPYLSLSSRITVFSAVARPFHSAAPLQSKAPGLGSTVEATDADFNDILLSSGNVPVLVDFYATWCGPCKLLAPVLQKAVRENDKAILVKIDVDKNEEVTAKYEIVSLPTVIAFRNGKVVDQFTGLRNEQEVKQFLDSVTAP
ncbi:thioredoxin-like protein [Cladochytrium replicatum]|nr:thioredoxin-like protein [Cladochytrium replicatum]